MSIPAPSSSTAISLILEDNDLPEVFRTADRGAVRSKGWHFLFVRVELIAISLAALAQVLARKYAPDLATALQLQIGDVQLLGQRFTASDLTHAVSTYLLPALFLGIAVLMFVLRLFLRFDQRWRGRRAIAEAAKGLAWRYGMQALRDDLAAAGGPLAPQQADQAFNAELAELINQSLTLRLDPPKAGDVELTQKMRDLRQQGAPVQRDAYVAGRLDHQKKWYADKANRYQRWTTRLQWARFGAYAAGAALIFYQGQGTNGLGIMTTIAGAFATWLAGKHYDDLSQSYGAMARRLTGLADAAPSIAPAGASSGAATAWAHFVDEVETLMDGEHRDWLRLTAR